MRQTSIPTAVVDALNALFDANPSAIATLLADRAPTDAAVAKAAEERAASIAQSRFDHERHYIDKVADGTQQDEPGVIPRSVIYGHGEARTLRPDETIGVIDIVNAILDALAPGKQVSTVHGPTGLDGFVLSRARAKLADPTPLAD